MSEIKDYIKTKLNEEQYEAAVHVDTSSLILAGAGSGKTRTLTYKIAYLMFGCDIKANNILAVTFTNKAASEMKQRLVELSKDISAIPTTPKKTEEKKIEPEDSIDSFLFDVQTSAPSNSQGNGVTIGFNDFKWIGTFHGVFLKLLKDEIESLQKIGFSYTKDFSILDTNDSQSIIKDILKKFGLQEMFKVNECKGFISKQKNQGITYSLFTKGASGDYDDKMGKIYEEYQKALELSNSFDFDDLLLIPYLLFQKDKEVLAKYIKKFKYILVDEAQDTNRIQFELIRTLSGEKGNVTLIGDDYQSIYGRRGAIMENFLNVKKYRNDIQIFKLQVNYRSRPHIVRAGSHIIKKNVNQYEKDIKAHRTGDDKIVVFSHASDVDEAANVVNFIKKLKNDKLQKRSDVAILYRTNAQSQVFEQILIQEGIPYKIFGAFKFFERMEVKDIVAYIKYILNPRSNISLKRILNIPNRKIGKTTLDKLEEYADTNNISLCEVIDDIANGKFADVTPMAKKGISEFSSKMNDILSKMEGLEPAKLVETLVKSINYKDYLLKEEGNDAKADERYENVGQLINMAEKYVEKGEQALRQFMEEITLLTDAADSGEGADAIKLMTVHSSKGLEFPVVFIVGLEENIFPLGNATLEQNLLEEERRLMYVAITRAENHLFLSHANTRMQRGQTKQNGPSRFIGELPEDLLKKYDLGGGESSEYAEETQYDINEGDTVSHKLFGKGYVLEVRNKLAIVKFYNPKFGVRKIELRFLVVY